MSEPLGQQRVGVEFGARPVAGPEPAALAVEQRVARSLERQVLGQFVDGEPGTLEPRFEEGFLALPLGVEKTAQDDLVRPARGRHWR